MFTPSPSCANGLARDVGWHHAARLIVGAASVLSLTLALPALAGASSQARGAAPGIAVAAHCTAAAPDTADDRSDRTSAYASDRTRHDSTDLELDQIDDDDEDGRERFRTHSPHGNLHIAAPHVRRQSHVRVRSLTPDDGLLPHQFVIDSVRRL